MSLVQKLDPRHWRIVRRLFDSVRKQYFTVSGAPRQLKLKCTVGELREVLGERHFTNAWELSYQYEGEDLNMRRPLYKHDEYNWYQLHVRGFETEDGYVEVHAHIELEPTEHPYEHISETNFNTEDGKRRLQSVLDGAGITYTAIDD